MTEDLGSDVAEVLCSPLFGCLSDSLPSQSSVPLSLNGRAAVIIVDFNCFVVSEDGLIQGLGDLPPGSRPALATPSGHRVEVAMVRVCSNGLSLWYSDKGQLLLARNKMDALNDRSLMAKWV